MFESKIITKIERIRLEAEFLVNLVKHYTGKDFNDILMELDELRIMIKEGL